MLKQILPEGANGRVSATRESKIDYEGANLTQGKTEADNRASLFACDSVPRTETMLVVYVLLCFAFMPLPMHLGVKFRTLLL